jgi:hypothetical protein
MEILGYQYITEQEAQNAVNLCNTYYGIPKTPDDITQTWCDYLYAELNTPPFWYIKFAESLLVVLGEPTTFDVVIPTPSPSGYTGNYTGNTL